MAAAVLVRARREAGEGLGGREVVLLDEHPLWLDALEAALSSQGIRVTGKATSPEEALRLIDAEHPDALVASLESPGDDPGGLECLLAARRRSPDLRIVAFTAGRDDETAPARADAYLPKTATASEVAAAVRGLCDRGKPAPALTARELEIVQLAARGHTNGQIAQQLWVSRSTVKFHLVNAYRKLGVSNRTQAGRYLFDHGLCGLPPDDRS